MVLCAKFYAKQTKIELAYARKCEKSIKNLKIATYKVILRI